MLKYNTPSASQVPFESTTDLTSGSTQDALNEAAASATLHNAEVESHGATGETVGTTNTQTLTNKTLTAPIIDIAKLTEQGSNPSTPSSGTKTFYSKTDGKLYTINSAGVVAEIRTQTFTTGIPTWSGANQGNIAFSSYTYYQDGSYMILDVRVEVSGTLGSGSILTLTLPNSLTIDTAKNPRGTDTTNAGRAFYGIGRWFQAGTGWKPVYAQYDSSTKIRFSENPGYVLDSQLTYSGQNSSIECIQLRIPISSW